MLVLNRFRRRNIRTNGYNKRKPEKTQQQAAICDDVIKTSNYGAPSCKLVPVDYFIVHAIKNSIDSAENDANHGEKEDHTSSATVVTEEEKDATIKATNNEPDTDDEGGNDSDNEEKEDCASSALAVREEEKNATNKATNNEPNSNRSTPKLAADDEDHSLSQQGSTTKPAIIANDEHDTTTTTTRNPTSPPTDLELIGWRMMQYHNDQKPQQIMDLFDREGGVAEFAGVTLLLDDFLEALSRTFASFPDMKFTYDSVKELDANTVVVDRIVAAGTHTGDPYAFGPYPPVQPQGARVSLDPERSILTIVDGKITKLKVIPLGKLTGPQGMYMQIGGFPV